MFPDEFDGKVMEGELEEYFPKKRNKGRKCFDLDQID